MKQLILRRFLPALLCLTLALSLAACGGEKGNAAKDGDKGALQNRTDGALQNGDDGTSGTLSGGKSNVPTSNGDLKQTAESLDRLRKCLEYSDQVAGAVAYLGQRKAGDSSALTAWLRESNPDLTEELPFLLDIPDECVLGGENGKLYCIVPRDENTSLAVNRIKWEAQGNGLHPVTEEVLYRDEHAQPVLIFVNAEDPDIQIVLVTNEGAVLDWIPQLDEYECPIVPIGDDGEAYLMDFAIFGYTTGLDYPDDWDSEGWGPEDGDGELAGDDWWLPPTDVGLADTSWVCDDWILDLHYDDSNPAYAGTADLYHYFEGDAELTMVYSGVWRMEDDCLRLELSDDAGTSYNGSFPILVSPSGEEMYFQRSRTGEGMPFLMDDCDSVGLTRSVG